jgi:hypothetical protein
MVLALSWVHSLQRVDLPVAVTGFLFEDRFGESLLPVQVVSPASVLQGPAESVKGRCCAHSSRLT